MHESKEKLASLTIEKEELEVTQKNHIKKMMEMPRLEEQYLRTARTLVRQHEVEHTHKEISE